MLATFDTKDSFLASVSDILDLSSSNEELRFALLTGIDSADEAVRTESGSEESEGLNLKIGTWVIRDDDVLIVQAIGAVGTAVVASLATGGLAVPLVGAAITQLADMCWRAWRKGAHLSKVQVAVYGYLAAEGPTTVIEIVKSLNRPDLSTDRVGTVLSSLQSFDMADGRVLPLVARDEDGLWRALRV
jgi:hypothetical protein